MLTEASSDNQGHTKAVAAVRFSESGRLLATVSGAPAAAHSARRQPAPATRDDVGLRARRKALLERLDPTMLGRVRHRPVVRLAASGKLCRVQHSLELDCTILCQLSAVLRRNIDGRHFVLYTLGE